jgi:hypothetical protein
MSAYPSLSLLNLQSTEQTFSQPKLTAITLCINTFTFIVLSLLLLLESSQLAQCTVNLLHRICYRNPSWFDRERKSSRVEEKETKSQREAVATKKQKAFNLSMKHSKKEKKAKGFSKGRSNDRKRQGPIMIEEILDGAPTFFKYDLTIREMIMRTDLTNESSPVIKRKFKPLDNPSNVLNVLQGVLLIKEGAVGNNVATGPSQHRCWRGCLTGTALDKFNEYALAVGNETAANLFIVEQWLITFFAPREVLRQQTRCIRFHMRKPEEVSTRQHVGAVATLNNTLSKLPPAFDDLQKVSDTDMMDILASKAPKGHKELMTDHGFDPQTATTAEFVEICERAETKEALQTRKQSHDSDDDSSDDEV